MNSAFSGLDWFIFGAYFLILALSSVVLSRVKVKTSRDYFVGGNQIPMFASAISILATSQSAATFLGGPEYSYSKDMTFLGFYLSAFLGAIIVSKFLIPKFYELKVVTVYELLEERFGSRAKKEAGVMFLFGRLLASGARLYIGALAISMILFLDIDVIHVAISIAILMLGALGYAYFGGIKSVIYSDMIQAFTYIGAGVAVLVYLYSSLDSDISTIISTLEESSKLKLIDFSLDGGFSIWALFSGWLLLNISAYGLDQDMTQRVLSCKNSKDAQHSLMMSIYLTIPVALLFMVIGLLLYIYYQHPEISHISSTPNQEFNGDKIMIFMYYILYNMPDGLRGLVTVGAVAAALSSSNSVLGAMSSVAVEDIYKPYRLKRDRDVDELHFVKAGRVMVLVFAILLSFMALLSFYWQHYTNLPLLSFALGVMVFAYSGLIGVYSAVLFTSRGTTNSVTMAFVGGVLSILCLQPYTFGLHIGFAYQLVIGSVVSFLIAISTKR
jgi:SSS family transporter